MSSADTQTVSFWTRLKWAWRILFSPAFARKMSSALPEETAPATEAKPPEWDRSHASGLYLLATFQREGRFIDFLQQEVTGFSDAEVGAAARVVHSGCRKVMDQYFNVEPVRAEPEGSTVTVPEGFDAQRIRLTGNVSGQPPYRGALKHHGWHTKEVRLPSLQPTLDYRVLAPAEVELE